MFRYYGQECKTQQLFLILTQNFRLGTSCFDLKLNYFIGKPKLLYTHRENDFPVHAMAFRKASGGKIDIESL